MPLFKFKGRDPAGQLISGERSAESSDQLSTLLFAEGITPIEIREGSAREPFRLKLKNPFARRKITISEISLLTRQLYTLTKAGVPISSAMKQLAKTSRNPRFADVMLSISQRLEGGQDLASAMSNYPDIFSPLVVSMVELGQNTGQLDTIFLRLNEYFELEGGTIKRLKNAIRYPFFVMLAIVAGVILINIFVIPAFGKVYQRANIPLPIITRILLGISDFFLNFWPYLLALVIAIGLGIRKYINTPNGRYRWHKLQLNLPIVGSLTKRLILMRFAETFAIVVNAGLPINKGLELVGESITNVYARTEILKMKDAIQRGMSFVQAASGSEIFTTLELQMFAISEQTGELGAMLTELAGYYQREVEYDLKHLTDVMEPLLLAGVALIVLFLALAVYMPIWNMVKIARA